MRRGLVVAGVAMLVLTGCSELPPGAASVVEGTTITDQQVDELANAQCAGVKLAAEQGQGQAISRKQLTQRALGLLIDIQVNLAFGESLDLEPRADQTAADFAQVEPLIKALPEKHHDYLEGVFHDWADGRDMVEQVGEQAGGATADDANAEQVLDAGYGEREKWLEKGDRIQTNPRYAPSKLGWPGEGDSSVSEPVSSFAKSATAQEPTAAFLEALPAGQRCG